MQLACEPTGCDLNIMTEEEAAENEMTGTIIQDFTKT